MLKNRWTRVVLPSLPAFRFPNICPGCLNPAPDEEVTIRSEKGRLQAFYLVAVKWRYLYIAVPFCRDCAERRKGWKKLDSTLLFFAAIAALIAAGWIASSLNARPWMFWGIFFCSALTFKLSVDCFVSDYRAIRIKQYDESHIAFAFWHYAYAQEFERLNSQD